jgi:hypothetical protein
MQPTNPDSDAQGRPSLSSVSRFRVNTPLVASQVIDGEAVLIHFETGCYYSAGKLGAEILHLADQKKPVGQIVNDLTGRYAADPGSIEQAVLQFVEQLHDEHLVVPEPPAEEAPAGHAETSPTSDPPGEKLAFEAPELQKFTDLEDLLLLDPIHDADEAGWPVAKPDATDPEA